MLVASEECAIRRLVTVKRMVAAKECAIEQYCASPHIELLCKPRASEPRISELFATKRHTMP
jgi:hypothetical protein